LLRRPPSLLLCNPLGNGATTVLGEPGIDAARHEAQLYWGYSCSNGVESVPERWGQPEDCLFEQVILNAAVEDLIAVPHVEVQHAVLRIRPDNW